MGEQHQHATGPGSGHHDAGHEHAGHDHPGHDLGAGHERSRFDEQAATWDDDPAALRRADEVAAAIVERVPLRPAWVALDFGAGTVQLSLRLADRVAEIDLVDTSTGMLAVAAERIAGRPGLRTVGCDLTSEPAPRPHYDLVVASMSLHHVPDLAGILAAFTRLLTPGGWLAVADLAADPQGDFHAHLSDFHGHHGFDPDDLGGRLTRLGWSEVGHVPVGTIVRGEGDQAREFGVNLLTGRAPQG